MLSKNQCFVLSSDSEEDKTTDEQAKQDEPRSESKTKIKKNKRPLPEQTMTEKQTITLSSDTEDENERKVCKVKEEPNEETKEKSKEKSKEENERPVNKIKTENEEPSFGSIPSFSGLFGMSGPPVFDLANNMQETQGNLPVISENKTENKTEKKAEKKTEKKTEKRTQKKKRVVFSKKSRSRTQMGDVNSIRKGFVIVLDAPREGERDFEDNPNYTYFYNQNERGSPLWIAQVQSFMRHKGKAKLKYYYSPKGKTNLSDDPEFVLDDKEFCVKNVDRAHRLTIKSDEFIAETLIEKLGEKGFGMTSVGMTSVGMKEIKEDKETKTPKEDEGSSSNDERKSGSASIEDSS